MWFSAVRRDVQLKLATVLGKDADALSTVHEWMRMFRCGHPNVHDMQRTGRAPIEDLTD
jgi:hypothetical protein